MLKAITGQTDLSWSENEGSSYLLNYFSTMVSHFCVEDVFCIVLWTVGLMYSWQCFVDA